MQAAQKSNGRSPRRISTALSSFWRNISFRKKTILYTSLLLYIFILVFGVLIYNRAVDSMNHMSQESTLQRLESLDEALKTQFSSYATITNTLLLDVNFQNKLVEDYPDSSLGAVFVFDGEIADHLDALSFSSKYPTTWDLYFAYPRVDSFESRIHLLNEAEGTEWFNQLSAQRRKVVTWRLEPKTATEPWRFLCCLAIRNVETGQTPAYFKMTVPLSHILPLLREISQSVAGDFLLCSQSGDILWSSAADSKDYSDYLLPYGELNALEPVIVDGSLGEHSVIALDGGKYGYTVYCIQDNLSPLSRYMDFGRYFLLILILIIIISLVTLRSSAGLVDGRIVELTAEIKSLDGNNLIYQPDMTSQDEVGELSRAFSELVVRIQDLIEQERRHEEARFELEVEALQAQINPHFLFNTLSIINLLAREIEADNISHALEALANFYRYSLHDGDKMTTLRDELTMLDNYLTICGIRYRNRLVVHKDIDPRVLDYSIPKLVLQPFCENAVFHGFSSGSGRMPELAIAVKTEDGQLRITITDNGDGMSHGELEKATKTGFAITNVHKRIQMLYGQEYGVSIASTPGEGTQVSIRMGQTVKAGEKAKPQ